MVCKGVPHLQLERGHFAAVLHTLASQIAES